MAAKSSDLVEEISGANLQMEGYVDVPTQSAKDLWELEALDDSPPLTILVPGPKAAVQLPYYEILLGDTCDFDGRIGGSTPTLSLLNGPPCRRYAV